MKNDFLALVIVPFALLANGCEPVHAWERGLLAHPAMRSDARPEETRSRNHMLGAREASQGASGERGGGCGCK